MLLAVLIGLSPVLVTAPANTGGAKPVCRNPGIIRVDDTRTPRTVRPLGDEPPAQHLLAVLRTDTAGCVKPVVVSAQVGTPRR